MDVRGWIIFSWVLNKKGNYYSLFDSHFKLFVVIIIVKYQTSSLNNFIQGGFWRRKNLINLKSTFKWIYFQTYTWARDVTITTTFVIFSCNISSLYVFNGATIVKLRKRANWPNMRKIRFKLKFTKSYIILPLLPLPKKM